MFRYIDRLRKESPEVRRRAAATFTFIIVALVLLAWFLLSTIRSALLSPSSDGAAPPKESGILQPY